MKRRQGVIFYRLLLTVTLAVIFLTAGLILARHFLQPDVLLRQVLYFEPQPQVQGLKTSQWWPDFAIRQQADIERIAQQRVPGLARYLDVDASGADPKLTLSVRGPYQLWPSVVERFDTLLASYLLTLDSDTRSPATLHRGEQLFRFHRSFPLSRLQTFVAATFTLAGVLLAWALPVPPREDAPLSLPTSPAHYRQREAHNRAQAAREQLPTREVPGLTTSAPKPPTKPAPAIAPPATHMETIPLVEIDLEQDQPATAAGQGWQPKYDQLAMRIHDLTTTTKPLRVLVAAAAIHDASPRFTVNLAIALTRQRLRVLLIETDPNSTELAELFDVPNEIGFCQWQHGEIDDDDAIQPSSLAGLSIMPAGTPLQPPNVTSPSPAAAPWPELTDTFDVLILYAPAALAVSPPELPNLLTQAHACLALTRRRRDIAPLRQRLAAFRQITACHPLAVVSLNS